MYDDQMLLRLSDVAARDRSLAGSKAAALAVLSQASYMSFNDPRLHFGLGVATSADIEVFWPSGVVEKFPAQTADRLITILEGHGIVLGRPFTPVKPHFAG